MNITKRIFRPVIPVLLAVFLGVLLPVTAAAETTEPPFSMDAKAVYAVNAETGEVLYEKNADVQLHPASTTKIMTVLLALENIPDLQTELTYPQHIFDELDVLNKNQYSGMLSMAGLVPGETMTLEQLIYGALLPSGNECAYIIADYIGGGSLERFADMMNERARQLGASNTNFVNPAGLDVPGHYSTARDMYLITAEAMRYPFFRTVVATPQYTAGPTNVHETLLWSSTNKTLFPDSSYYYEPMVGIKTGTLHISGRCFVSAAQKDGLSCYMVVLGGRLLAEDGTWLPNNTAFEQSVALYRWIFSEFPAVD